MDKLTADEILRAVQAALAEDIGPGDATTLATVPENAPARAAMVAREPLTVAGLDFAETAFRELSPKFTANAAFRTARALKLDRPCSTSPAPPAPCSPLSESR